RPMGKTALVDADPREQPAARRCAPGRRPHGADADLVTDRTRASDRRRHRRPARRSRMNPLRVISGEWTPALVGLLVLAVLSLLLGGWFRRRERRGDWGPGLAGVTHTAGYSPADLRGAGDFVE